MKVAAEGRKGAARRLMNSSDLKVVAICVFGSMLQFLVYS
jgi:hypothetical protein